MLQEPSAFEKHSESDHNPNKLDRDSALARHLSAKSLRGLDWLNFLLADVQTGVGPFLAIYLAAYGWNEERVGLALTIGGIAGIAAQTPAGALVDKLKSKRALIAIGVIALAIGALVIASMPSFWPVVTAQMFIGVTSSVFMPAIAAISLGIVGRELFNRRQGRNQTFNSGGNVVAALMMGLIGYWVSNRAVFFFVVLLAMPTILSLLAIRPEEIDYEMARGATEGEDHGAPASVIDLLRDHPLLIFLCCAVLFHFANAAMLPLLGEMLAKGKGRSSMMFMSACVITTQATITLLASWAGGAAGSWGRKPLLLIGFGVLPIRGILYTLTNSVYLLVAIQVLDGIGVGIFGVVSVLVIADLTRGTGRFNVTLGAIATAVGIGAALSQTIAGSIVHHFGDRAGFLFLASVAAVAFTILWTCVPETLHRSGFSPPDSLSKRAPCA
ncbi:MAG TPA: MFS transporter [Candidatus Binataceae bacterium]|nr:MFS transporter [Candidatus Binataceae bacterium]